MRNGFGGATTVVVDGDEDDEPPLEIFTSANDGDGQHDDRDAATRRRMMRPGGICLGGGPGFGGITPGRRSTTRGIRTADALQRARSRTMQKASVAQGRS